MSVRALYEALRGTLDGAGVWGERCYADAAPAGVVRPYAVWFVAAGGERNVRGDRADAGYTVTVKCVADTFAAAAAGAEQIADVLNDTGAQDRRLGMVQPSGWTISTVTADRAVHLVERVDGAQAIYHEGYQFLVVMEANSGYS